MLLYFHFEYSNYILPMIPTLEREAEFAVVFRVCAEEVLEQADYLYSCAETRKLYQLLLQHKDR